MQAIDKKTVHDLVDRLTPDQIPVAADMLRSIVTEVFDDEPLTEQDIQRMNETKAAIKRGERGIPMEEVLADFGLALDDFPLKK